MTNPSLCLYSIGLKYPNDFFILLSLYQQHFTTYIDFLDFVDKKLIKSIGKFFQRGRYNEDRKKTTTKIDFTRKYCPIYKIASFENIDLPLIKRVVQTGKPMIVSTGMANVAEIQELVDIARENGCEDLTLLKCTSSYPASPKGSNLLTIPHMKELFKCNVGVSDHTLGIGVAVASMALGARVVEKHFTLSRSDGVVDSAFSLEPTEMAQLVRECDTAVQALGHVSYRMQEQERKSLVYRRSLYVVKDMQAGDVLTSENMRSIRPGLGIATKYYEILIGKKVKRNICRGTAVSWDIVE